MQITAEDGTGARPTLTSFVGRRDELVRLRALITSSRLLTITGPGGSGKTRLAEELVTQLARSLSHAVAVAYLAGASKPADVDEIVAAAAGLRGRGEPATTLLEYLRDRRFLLVLDNCEHVRDATAQLALRILQSCPGVTLLATSRRPLMVPGEQLFPVGGLLDDAAVTLFTDRVRLALPSFVLAEDQRPLLIRLCARLDGMPLAIELAAARLRYVGLAEFEDRMTGHLADLGSVGSVAPERQRTLRGAIDWSHDLLEERQRVLWRRLCIFVGGFTLQAAEAVATFPPLASADVERLLGDLVDRSMVVFDLPRDRYRVIEAMREYGLERLLGANEEKATAARHRAWIIERVEEVDRRWWGADQGKALDAISAEAENLRAALESCRGDDASEDGLRIATASLWYWVTRGSLGEAARWLAAFLDQSPSPGLRSRALWRAGYIAVLQGRHADARELLARAERLADEAKDPGTRAYARIITCLRVMYEQSDEDALALAREALENPAADAMTRCWGLIGIGLASFLREDWDECRRASLDGIEMCRAVGESWNQELHLRSLAYAEWQLGNLAAAETALLDALRIDRRLDDVWHLAWTSETLAWVTVDRGRNQRAARILGIASAFWARTGSGLARPWRRYHDAAETDLRWAIGEPQLADEIEAGAQLDHFRALSFMLEDVQTPPAPAVAALRVSPRELEVATLVAEGCGNREIGERLFLSPRTVETHIQHLMDKLAVGSRAEIAAWHTREVAGKPQG
jgi:serine/threonine-protein kinase PknK